MLLRYLCSIIWVGLLSCFSYGSLIINFFNERGLPLEETILESHESSWMILANVGLVLMLYIDKILTHLITKQKNKNHYIEVILFINIFIAIFLTVIAQQIKHEGFILVSWFKLSYLLSIFIILLTIYKADSLKITHISTDRDILPSKNF